jgi:L-iditol 2-dehydrogenase
MRACGICGGDLMSWYKKAPLDLGHEVAGEVVEARGGEARVKVGDRVFVHHHVACHACHFCAHQDYVHCAQFSQNRIYPGGFAEYIRVSAPIARGDVLTLPSQLSFETGTLVEPLACCIKGINRAGLLPGDSLGVIGAGPVGIMSIALARRTRGAGIVIAADTVESRRRYARDWMPSLSPFRVRVPSKRG